MTFLHKREYLSAGDVVVVDCDHQCNVMLLEDHEFRAYRSGQSHRYRGGFYQRFPARITVPYAGWWNVTLDLGGRSARVRHSFGVVRA
jgi:hypothetical protein